MEYICVFEYTNTLHSFPQIYSDLPLYKMKWNSFFFNLLPRLYSNIICKNIVKIFQKFEMGYTQTCTSLESSKMWHPKGGHCNVLSRKWVHLKLVHYKTFIQWFICRSLLFLYCTNTWVAKCKVSVSNAKLIVPTPST